MERFNARDLRADSLPEPVSLATIDVAFISARLVLGPVLETFRGGPGDVVVLVKPQFEAGRGEVRGGVVRDPAIHERAVRDVADAAAALGTEVGGSIPSPILGPEGNREFLLWARVPGRPGSPVPGVGA